MFSIQQNTQSINPAVSRGVAELVSAITDAEYVAYEAVPSVIALASEHGPTILARYLEQEGVDINAYHPQTHVGLPVLLAFAQQYDQLTQLINRPDFTAVNIKCFIPRSPMNFHASVLNILITSYIEMVAAGETITDSHKAAINACLTKGAIVPAANRVLVCASYAASRSFADEILFTLKGAEDELESDDSISAENVSVIEQNIDATASSSVSSVQSDTDEAANAVTTLIDEGPDPLDDDVAMEVLDNSSDTASAPTEESPLSPMEQRAEQLCDLLKTLMEYGFDCELLATEFTNSIRNHARAFNSEGLAESAAALAAKAIDEFAAEERMVDKTVHSAEVLNTAVDDLDRGFVDYCMDRSACSIM